VIKRDKSAKIKFAASQNQISKDLLLNYDNSEYIGDYIVFIENNKIYKKSDAVIRIASNLDGLYKYLKFIKIIPKFVRDYLYDLIAKNRYKLFGKRESCMIPDDKIKSRFLFLE